MFTSSALRVLAICSVVVGGVFIAGYARGNSSPTTSPTISDGQIANNINAAPTSTLASVPSRTYTPQNSPVSIAINQNGNIRQADSRGYINVGIRETYKIEINSPSYTSAVSVKIDGVPIIDGLICDRSVTLERPYVIAKQFIVLEEGNPGLDQNGGVNNPSLGLIEVKFVPLKRRAAIALESVPKARNDAPASSPSIEKDAKESAGASRSTAVGTGLSGSSSQEFMATNEWVEAPEIAPIYTKKYRLIGFSPNPVTLHNMTKPRPTEINDAVPPRL
ncbi:hypothetical protein HCU40_08600 [Pseudanabaena biceps]|nr:hypothetical protein [Pseudanabaena biceps]